MMKPRAPEPPRPPVGADVPEIMTVPQVAAYLQSHPSTIYRLLKLRNFPGLRVGSDWRFQRSAIERWVTAQEIKVANEEPAADGVQRVRRGPPIGKKPIGKKRGRPRRS